MPKTIRIPLGRCVVDVLMDVPWHVRDELEIYFAANEEEIYRTMGRGCGVELTLECKVHRPGEYGNDEKRLRKLERIKEIIHGIRARPTFKQHLKVQFEQSQMDKDAALAVLTEVLREITDVMEDDDETNTS